MTTQGAMIPRAWTVVAYKGHGEGWRANGSRFPHPDAIPALQAQGTLEAKIEDKGKLQHWLIRSPGGR